MYVHVPNYVYVFVIISVSNIYIKIPSFLYEKKHLFFRPSKIVLELGERIKFDRYQIEEYVWKYAFALDIMQFISKI